MFKNWVSVYFLRRNPTSGVCNSKHQCERKHSRCPGNALQTLGGKASAGVFSGLESGRFQGRGGPGGAAGPQALWSLPTAAPSPFPATVPGQRVSTGLCRVADPLAPDVGSVSVNPGPANPSALPASDAKQSSEAEHWCREGPKFQPPFQPRGTFVGFLELLESSESDAEGRTDLEEQKAKGTENQKNIL